MKRILLIGTSSGAGKTTVSAMVCRYLSSTGYRPAPFKGSNLSLNSYATKDGGEIGMGQAFQAWACGIEPETDMNPVLMKPCGNGVIQLIVNGQPFMDVTREKPMDKPVVMEQVHAAFDRLSEDHDFIVCEGSGSPVELNLMERDLANTGLMRELQVPTILVGDIERGGVFAAIYGTWRLIPDDLKHLMKGFVINRFRGDPSVLRSGIEQIESLTGMRCIGIMQYAPDIMLPEEDTVSGHVAGSGRFDDIRKVYDDSLDRLTDMAEDSLDMDLLDSLI